MTRFKVSAQLKKRQAGPVRHRGNAIGIGGHAYMRDQCVIMLPEVEVTWSKNVDREASSDGLSAVSRWTCTSVSCRRHAARCCKSCAALSIDCSVSRAGQTLSLLCWRHRILFIHVRMNTFRGRLFQSKVSCRAGRRRGF